MCLSYSSYNLHEEFVCSFLAALGGSKIHPLGRKIKYIMLLLADIVYFESILIVEMLFIQLPSKKEPNTTQKERYSSNYT